MLYYVGSLGFEGFACQCETNGALMSPLCPFSFASGQKTFLPAALRSGLSSGRLADFRGVLSNRPH